MMRTVKHTQFQVSQSAHSGARFLARRAPRHLSRYMTLVLFLALFSLCLNSVATQAKPSSAKERAAAAKKTSAKASAAKNAVRRVTATSSTQSHVFGWFRARPQMALFAGALGALTLAAGLVAVSRPKRQRDEVPPPVGDSDENERLQMLLDFERAARKENEVLFWRMAMHGGDALHISYPREGTIQWFGQIDAMLGYTQNSFPRTIEGWATAIHPDETEKIVALYTEACRGQNEFQIQYRMRHRNGTYRDWLHRGRPILDEKKKLVSFVGACTDVTERNRAVRDARSSDEKVAKLLAASTESVIVCDEKGYIVTANTAAERLFETTQETLIGAPYAGGHWNIVGFDGEAMLANMMPPARVCETGALVAKIEHAIQFKDGTITRVTVNGAPLHDEKGVVCGCVLVLSDVSAHLAPTNHVVPSHLAAPTVLYDIGTGLASQTLFQDRLEHAIRRAVNAGTQIAVLMLSEENHHVIANDASADTRAEWVKTVALRLQRSVREFDTITLLDGKRFAILLEDVSAQNDAQILIDRVLDALQKPVCLRGQALMPSPRIGAALSAPRSTPTAIMNQAKEALSRASKNDALFYGWHESQSDEKFVVETKAAEEIAPEVSPHEAREKIALVKSDVNEANESKSSVYFSTEVVRDEVSSEGIVDGTLDEGLTVRRITPSGVLVDAPQNEPNAKAANTRSRYNGVANGGVIKSLVALRKAKREMEKTRNAEAEIPVDTFLPPVENAHIAPQTHDGEAPPPTPRLLREA